MQTTTRMLAAIAGLGLAGAVAAQPRESLPVDLPDGPAKPGFDIERFSNVGNGWFETFYVEETPPLREALDDGRLADDTRMLIMETAGGHLAFVTDQMAYHHLAQGTIEGRHWLATF
jgi:hypothetical protein